MKKHFTLLNLAITVLLSSASLIASAAVVTVTGPSKDALTTPPAQASDVSKVYCYGSKIILTGPTDVTGNKYEWYKIDNTGTKQLVKEGINGDNGFEDQSTDAGYYDYQLVVINAAGCSSAISNIQKVYVLPDLSLSLNTAGPICSSSQTTVTLALQSPLPSGYTYNYQWYRNGTAITTTQGTQPTYDVAENTATSGTPILYKLRVTFVLSTGCYKESADSQITVVNPPATPTISFN
ncbi:hypothetical protein [Mucilaginibacter agri]|uniref:Ig-like domain-containing protein n=1 Tax=Mucilaginibacter agri TaxID=2695265 RepID=A0A965ZJ50_9SPHI|nr:hypothetical protein [Mucilaginibacter agri]NCD72060.1 hypothetical protein [Mucilaginibacter agri]